VSTSTPTVVDPEAGAARLQPDAFISYAREDVVTAGRLREGLEARGKAVWVDTDEIPFSASWREKARAGIEAAKATIFVLTSHWLQSDACAWELEQALAANKKLVPVAVPPAVDGGSLPDGLADLNWIELGDGGAPDAQALDALAETLEVDLAWRDAHARLLVQGSRWEREGRRSSALLRGEELDEAERWLAGQVDHEQAATPTQREYILSSRRGQTRRLRLTIAAVVAALLISLGLAAVALVQRGRAVSNQQTAESRELATAALSLMRPIRSWPRCSRWGRTNESRPSRPRSRSGEL
jgi:hypothetical protein